MKSTANDLFGFFMVVYFLGSLIAFIFGAGGANWSCHGRPLRIEKFFPAYKAACYLFSEEGK